MKTRIGLKILLGFFMFKIISGQDLPQPIIIGKDLKPPTIQISRFVEIGDGIGLEADANQVTISVKSILEELFQETRYVLVDNNADFVASLEIVYLGKPNEAFSIIGLFNRRNTSTEMSVLLNVKNNKNGREKSFRGIGEISTIVQSTRLQIQEDTDDFTNSAQGGALRKAIGDAIKKVK